MKDPDDLMPEWMVSPAYPPGPIAFERIAINHGALCIECKACNRRSALTRENAPNIIRMCNKALVKDGKFKCSPHDCGSTEVRLYNAHTMDEAKMFLAGDTLPEGREVP
jgi:hypothetical protein